MGFLSDPEAFILQQKSILGLPVFRDEIAGAYATFEITPPAFVFDCYRGIVATVSYDS